MTFTTADLARRAGIAAVEDQTPPELIASSRLMVQALMSGVPMAMMLEHLIGSALAVLQLMPDPQAEAENLVEVLVEELERLGLLP